MSVKVIKQGEEGSHPIISNLVCMPEDNRSVLKRISALPKEQQKAILEEIIEKKYPDKGYEGIKYDWELNARPSQLIPFDFNNDWNIYAFTSGRGAGKALAIDTDIPTPSGFKKIKDLQIGDKVFDEHGDICNVTDVTGIMNQHDCYKITFSDKTEIIADADHRWNVFDRKRLKSLDHYRSKNKIKEYLPYEWTSWDSNIQKNTYSYLDLVDMQNLWNEGVSSKEIARIYNKSVKAIRLRLWRGSNIKFNNHTNFIFNTEQLYEKFLSGENLIIPLVNKPVQYEKKELPIHPWVFGYLLGDGDTRGWGVVSCDERDRDFLIDEFDKHGFKHKTHTKFHPNHFRIHDLKHSWINLELHKGKYIPEIYKISSVEDRLELLRGLIDSDGCVDKHGIYKFTNTNKDLIKSVKEICDSLGIKSVMYYIPARTDKRGTHSIESNSILINTTYDLAKLDRKSKLGRYSWKREQQVRKIVNIEKCKSVPVKCITVDSKSEAFLCTRHYIPTLNSRTASEWVRYVSENHPGIRIALVGATTGDVLNTIVTGESGLLNTSPKWFYPKWNPTYQRLTWPNGSECEYFTSEKPDRLRGRNFSHAWIDEVTSWRYVQETLDMLSMTLRIGNDNRMLLTTTPKNVEAFIKILKLQKTWSYVCSTFENQENLSPKFIDDMIERYAGTRIGQQELEAEILMDDDKALWKREWIDNNRVLTKLNFDGNIIPRFEVLPDFLHVVIAVDPAVSVNKKSAETALSVAAYGEDGKYYVLYADAAKYTPDEWAKKIYELYDEYLCDSIVIEVNQGGNLVIQNLRNLGRQAPIVEVRARRGKLLRAEPVASLYERNLVRHFGTLQKCETQMCNFNQHHNKELCDVVDSTVYALQALMDRTERYYSSGTIYAVGGTREVLTTFRVL